VMQQVRMTRTPAARKGARNVMQQVRKGESSAGAPHGGTQEMVAVKKHLNEGRTVNTDNKNHSSSMCDVLMPGWTVLAPGWGHLVCTKREIRISSTPGLQSA